MEVIADYPDHLRNWNEIPETSQLAHGQKVRQMIEAVSPKNKKVRLVRRTRKLGKKKVIKGVIPQEVSSPSSYDETGWSETRKLGNKKVIVSWKNFKACYSSCEV